MPELLKVQLGMKVWLGSNADIAEVDCPKEQTVMPTSRIENKKDFIR
jgi:hypothetical protein